MKRYLQKSNLIVSVFATLIVIVGFHAVMPVAFASTNLIANPTFEATTTEGAGIVPLDWANGSWGDASSAQFTYPVSGEDDNYAAQVSIASYADVGEGNGAAEWYFNNVPVTGGTLYAFSDWYKSDTDSYVIAQWTLSDGSFAYDNLATIPSTNDNWTQTPIETFTAPLNAVSVTILHLIQSAGTLTVDNYSLSVDVPSDTDAFLNGMVSLTFDDGYTSQYNNALPILRTANTAGTFYIITDDIGGSGGENLFDTSDVSTHTVTTTSSITWSGLYIDPTEPEYEFSDNYSATASTTVMVSYLLNGTTPSSTVIGTLPATASGTVDLAFSLPTDSSGTVLAQPINITQALVGTGTLTASNPILGEYPTYMNPNQLLGLQFAGNEVDSHTETHPDLTALSTASATAEISGSRSALTDIGLAPVDGFAYPYGNYNSNIEGLVGDAGYVSARTVDVGYNDKTTNPLLIKSYSVVASTTLPMVESWINTAAANKWWLVLTFHDIDPSNVIAQNDETYGTTPQMLQQIISYIQSQNIPIKTMDQGIAALNSANTVANGTLAINTVINGGTATPDQFTFQVDNNGVTGSLIPFDPSGLTVLGVEPGSDTVTEVGIAPNYTMTSNDCDNVTVSSNATTTCTIINTFAAPTSTPSSTTNTLTVTVSGLTGSDVATVDATDNTNSSLSVTTSTGNAIIPIVLNTGDSYSIDATTTAPGYTVDLSGCPAGTLATDTPCEIAFSLQTSSTTPTSTAPDTITINTNSLPDGTIETPYSEAIVATSTNATDTFNWMIASGTLPSIGIDPATGILSGTPNATGTFNFTVVVTNADASASTTQDLTLTIDDISAPTSTPTSTAPVVTINPPSGALVDGMVNTSYGPVPFTADDGNATDTFTWTETGTLPPGITFDDASGTILGMPTVTATSSFSVTATSASDPSVSSTADYTLTVDPAPAAPTSTLNVVLNVDNTAGGTANPSDFTISVIAGHPLPTSTFPGDASGTVLTIDAAPASYGVNISSIPNYTEMTNGNCAGSSSNAPGSTVNCLITETFTAPAVVIAPTSLPDATVGSSYNETISASNGDASDTFAWTIATDTLSSDFTVATSTVGVTITGTPSGTGTYELGLVATSNAYANSSTQDYSLTVDAAPAPVSAPAITGGGGGGGEYYDPAPAPAGGDLGGQVLGASTTNPVALLQLLNSLEQQLIALEFKAAGGCSFTFHQNLSTGMTNSEVKDLQVALNISPLTEVAVSGSGSPGNESTYFGNATKNAVATFQNIFASDILIPNGLTSGNGFVGSATRVKLNELCSE